MLDPCCDTFGGHTTGVQVTTFSLLNSDVIGSVIEQPSKLAQVGSRRDEQIYRKIRRCGRIEALYAEVSTCTARRPAVAVRPQAKLASQILGWSFKDKVPNFAPVDTAERAIVSYVLPPVQYLTGLTSSS
jgi:hypothetical protein